MNVQQRLVLRLSVSFVLREVIRPDGFNRGPELQIVGCYNDEVAL